MASVVFQTRQLASEPRKLQEPYQFGYDARQQGSSFFEAPKKSRDAQRGNELSGSGGLSLVRLDFPESLLRILGHFFDG